MSTIFLDEDSVIIPNVIIHDVQVVTAEIKAPLTLKTSRHVLHYKQLKIHIYIQ